MGRGASVACAIAIALGGLAGTSCSRRAPAPAPAVVEVDPLAALRAFESERRAASHLLEPTVQDRAFGADPYDLTEVAGGRFVGVLRGRDAIVLLGPDLRAIARVPTVRAPTGVAALADGDVLVASEIEPVLARYRVAGATLVRQGDIPLGDVAAVRGVATGPEGVAYVVEEHDDRLLTIDLATGKRLDERRVARGPVRVLRTAGAVVVLSVLGHTIGVHPIDVHGRLTGPPSQAVHDGPFWGMAAAPMSGKPDELLIVAGGVEDRPLDRTGGFFGNVDSFVYAYRWNARTGVLRREGAIDVGEQGLIVPKGIAFERALASDRPPATLVTSYGGARALRVVWSEAPTVTAVALPPGTSAIVATRAGGFALANPLLDAWGALGPGGSDPRLVRVVEADDRRTDRERVGEALFFTGLMAPGSSAEGSKSVFSCETCHFEGYTDGRIHHTGRGDVRATTKPLVGLFNNRPHFSRALDPDLAAVAENEFRVAGAPSPRDPHFDVDVATTPWLAELGLASGHLDATELRLSLMAFLMRATHRTNPRAPIHRAFSAEERRGADLFAARCEGCHEARVVADDPGSRVGRDRWETAIFGGGPIVWASDAYAKTGVEPYVHADGARVPSLRRLYKKRPYLTNGSAPDLPGVLRAVRLGPAGLRHGGTGEGEALDERAIASLVSFLDLL